MKCPKCHSENPSDSSFCSKCGTQLSPSEEIPVSYTKTLQIPRKELSRGSIYAGRYQVIEELGRGGMGVVYKADDTKLKRTVALKFLPPELASNQEAKERFIREAQAAAALDHPNICTVYEVDEAEEKTFISMAYIEGQSLREKIRSGPLKMEEALDIAIQIANGLEEAHKKGVVHREIKSDNIMVTSRGQSKIMDFGLAKIRGGTLLTREGIFMGTVAYMSPEQVSGKEVDHKTDIWSLGVVFYEMLTGKLPFQADNEQAMIYSILNKDPEPLTGLLPDVSSELDHVVLNLLAKDLNLRYSSATELLQDLENLKAGKSITAPQVEIDKLKNSVAVIDFANITKDATCGWLSGGIAETVTVDLKKIAALSVVSREKVLKALGNIAGQKITEQQIINVGHGLKVRWIVWGGFQKFGDVIRITAHFTDVSTGDLAGSTKVDGTMDDIFKLQDQIITNLMDSLQLELSDSEIKKIETPETEELEAYEYCAKGRQLFLQFGKASFDQALKFFEKAIEMDPKYALAYSGLGSIHIFRFIERTDPRDLDFGISNLQKAIKYDPELVDPYPWLTYAYMRKHRIDDAIKAGRKAVELDPDNFIAHYFLGVSYMTKAAMEYDLKRYPDAVRHLKKSQPNFEPSHMALACIYMLNGQYQEAKKELEKAAAIEESGKFVGVKFVGGLTLLGNLYFRQQQLDIASDWHQRSLKILEKSDNLYREPFTALSYFGLGNVDFSRDFYDKALKNYKRACEVIEKNPKALGIGYFLVKVRLGMAKAFHKLGMSHEQKQQFQEAIKLFGSKQGYDFSWIWEGSDAQVYYEIASYHALLNRRKEAFRYLQKAIDCGWGDLPFLELDESFNLFRNVPEYKKIAQDLKARKLLP